MFNVEALLGQMLSGGLGGGRRHRDSGFGIPGVSKAQLGVGAIGIAIAAWEHFKNKAPDAPSAVAATPPPASSAPPPPPPPPMTLPPPPMAPPALATAGAVTSMDSDDRQADAAHLIRSMIAAAHADGAIDAEERAGILERTLEAGLDAQAQQFLIGELRAPATLEQIVAATRPALRLETYAAALIAMNVDTEAERSYLDRLAAALDLSPEDRQRVQEQLA